MTRELTTFRVEGLVPLEPFSFTPLGWDRFGVTMVADSLTMATDDEVRTPLWHWSPSNRMAVLHERRRRFPGVFETDEIDPEFH